MKIFYAEILALLVILFYQVRNFLNTRSAISDIKQLFPQIDYHKDKHIIMRDFDESEVEQLVFEGSLNKVFRQMIADINTYLKNNKGAVDFNIIKSITDRTAAVQENEVSSTVSIPLYLGLIGTFSGVILGLLNIIMAGDKLMQGNNMTQAISGLLIGVSVAMVVSLVGLALTTYNNNVSFRKAVAQRDIRRNAYFTFLQKDLLHRLDNNLHTSLDLLKDNISDFNSQFAQNLQVFDQTFADNIRNLRDAVTGMSTQIDTVQKNTALQINLLTELKRINYDQMVQDNIHLFEKMRQAGPILTDFVREQQSLTDNMSGANQFMIKLGDLLNRVSTFETSVNNLGTQIASSGMLGAEVMNLVGRHIQAIDSKEKLISQYAAQSNDEFTQYLDNAHTRIREIKRKIELDLEGAYNFESIGNVLQNLTHLKSISEHIIVMQQDISILKTRPAEIPAERPQVEKRPFVFEQDKREKFANDKTIEVIKRTPPLLTELPLVKKVKRKRTFWDWLLRKNR